MTIWMSKWIDEQMGQGVSHELSIERINKQ